MPAWFPDSATGFLNTVHLGTAQRCSTQQTTNGTPNAAKLLHDPMFTHHSSQSIGSIPGPRSAVTVALALLAGLITGVSAMASSTEMPTTSTPNATATRPTAKIESQPVTETSSAVTVNVTAAQAARAARHEFGGKVLGVMLEANSKTPYYRVRLISRGEVHIVRINAHE